MYSYIIYFYRTSPISVEVFLLTVAIGSLTLPLGILARFIPPTTESDNAFGGILSSRAIQTEQLRKKRDAVISINVEEVSNYHGSQRAKASSREVLLELRSSES